MDSFSHFFRNSPCVNTGAKSKRLQKNYSSSFKKTPKQDFYKVLRNFLLRFFVKKLGYSSCDVSRNFIRILSGTSLGITTEISQDIFQEVGLAIFHETSRFFSQNLLQDIVSTSLILHSVISTGIILRFFPRTILFLGSPNILPLILPSISPVVTLGDFSLIKTMTWEFLKI